MGHVNLRRDESASLRHKANGLLDCGDIERTLVYNAPCSGLPVFDGLISPVQLSTICSSQHLQDLERRILSDLKGLRRVCST